MMLAEGEVAKTKVGTVTTPFPRVDTSTNLKAINTIKRVRKWLVDNALKTATWTDNEWLVFMFGCMNPGKLSQADIDVLNDYLFGDEE